MFPHQQTPLLLILLRKRSSITIHMHNITPRYSLSSNLTRFKLIRLSSIILNLSISPTSSSSSLPNNRVKCVCLRCLHPLEEKNIVFIFFFTEKYIPFFPTQLLSGFYCETYGLSGLQLSQWLVPLILLFFRILSLQVRLILCLMKTHYYYTRSIIFNTPRCEARCLGLFVVMHHLTK